MTLYGQDVLVLLQIAHYGLTPKHLSRTYDRLKQQII